MERYQANTASRGGVNTDALNMDGNKVTVGFKCAPKVKLQLANAAIEIGLTLSEYMENLVLDYQTAKDILAKEKDALKKQIAHYENDILHNIFNFHKGQTINFTAADGSAMQVEIREPKDVYTLLINSFKVEQ